MLKRRQSDPFRSDALFPSNMVNRTEFLLDVIPHCLKASSSTFQEGFASQLNNFVAPLIPFQVEQLVLVYYKISIHQLHQQLWSVYLQSGEGQLEGSHLCRRPCDTLELHYWPAYFLSLTIARAYTTMFYRESMNYDQHLDSVKRYLSRLEEQRYGLLVQYDMVKEGMRHYTPDMNHQLENYVRQYALSSVNIYFETVISLLKHDYMDRFIQMQLMKDKPTQEQVCTTDKDRSRSGFTSLSLLQINKANKIAQLTFNRIRAEREHALYRDCLYYKQLPKFCTLLAARTPIILTIVQDPQARADVFTQYNQVIDRAKNEMSKVLVTAATHRKDYAQRELNTYLTEHWNEEHRLDNQQRLPNSMRQLMEQRQQNITDCIRSVYEQKEKFLLDVPTTMTRELLRML